MSASKERRKVDLRLKQVDSRVGGTRKSLAAESTHLSDFFSLDGHPVDFRASLVGGRSLVSEILCTT